MSAHLDTVMQEARLFPPPKGIRGPRRIGSFAAYEAMWNDANRDIEAFWGKLADELHWFKPYSKVLEWNEPFANWFVGGQTNVSYNCLDAHLASPRRNKAALLWEGEPGDQRTLTYQQLHDEVCRFANVLLQPGHSSRRRRFDLYADGAGACDRHAGLRPHRRGAFGDFRRVF